MTITAQTIVAAFQGCHRARIDLDGTGEMYVRRSNRRLVGHKLRQALDLADITITDEHRGQGVFTAALKALEEAAVLLGADGVYVESVMNPIVAQAVERRGYAQTGDSHPALPCYGKVLNAESGTRRGGK